MLYSFLLITLLTGCSESRKKVSTKYDIRDFPNILNIKNAPEKSVDWSAFSFSDMGAWFSFALPNEDSSTTKVGSFPGPFLMTHGKWLSKSLISFQPEIIGININGAVKLDRPTEVKITSFPGLLNESWMLDDIAFQSDLCFVSNRCAIMRLIIDNRGNETELINLSIVGSVFENMASITPNGNSVKGTIKGDGYSFKIKIPQKLQTMVTVSDDSLFYKISLKEPIELGSESTYEIPVLFVFESDSGDFEKNESLVNSALALPGNVFLANQDRWNGYLNDVLQVKSEWSDKKEYQDIAVKSLITLVNNWRSSSAALHHDGLIPSYAVSYFNGFWGWDSWKHSVAIARFETNLAKDQIRAMFDYQDKDGMIIDCIFRDPKENNARDSKPPLAAWSVLEVFRHSNDIGFLKEMYDKLYAYHYWWYKNRDHDGNGLCEYGSTDGTKEAAMWESGWDDAVRFDDAGMVKNNDGAWSVDQESADLNSYLYVDKLCLATIADQIYKVEDANRFRDEAEILKKLLQENMFDENTGFFYDRRIKDGSLVMVKDPGGWVPLWAKVATNEQAAKVKEVMRDTTVFNTTVPFPTVSKDNPKFMSGYWRGAVWIDQAYFGVKALEYYGYEKEAKEMAYKLFDNTEGLKNCSDPIRENYDPISGKGLRVNNFSWSAAHYLLMFRGE